MDTQFRYSMATTDFYLERVGFEAKVNLRRNLKAGENVVGRFDVANIDIGVESGLCSRRHCSITVSSTGVVLKDLKSSNGTTLNGDKKKDETAELHEGDLIGIVGGNNPMSELIGNYNFVVYRLRKYSSNNLPTIEIDDDDPILLSDDEDYNNPICLDSDGDESVNSGEHFDVAIQLSRTFNMEMKKELEDIEEECKALKKEQIEFLQGDDDEGFNECQFVSFDDVARGDDNDQSDSNDSDRTVFFPVSDQQDHVMSDKCKNIGMSGNEGESSSSFIEKTNSDSNNGIRVLDILQESINTHPPILSQKELNDAALKLKDVLATLNTEYDKIKSLKAKQIEPDNMITDNDYSDSKSFDQKKANDLKLKLKETVAKLNANENRKRQLELIEPKPLGNKRRKSESASGPRNGQLKTESMNIVDKKEKLKNLASAIPKNTVENKTKTHTTAKVKFTPHNRGFFLTLRTNLPVSPRKLNARPKVKEREITTDALGLSIVAATPVELEQQIHQNMSCATAPQIISSSEVISPSKFSGNSSPKQPIINNDNVEVDLESFLCHDEDLCHESNKNIDLENHEFYENNNKQNEEDDKVNEIDDEEDDDADEEDDEERLYEIIMQLPPDTGTVNMIETVPRPSNLKSILKTANPGTSKKLIRTVSFRELGFQLDPRHEIISTLTSYMTNEFETVTDFCKNRDENISSFADVYDYYEEYRRTLVALLMVELWKEIELEYENSLNHSFITVTVNDSNLEKRGDGRRMVFHCQDDSLYKSLMVSDDHLVLVRCDHNGTRTEFVAMVTDIKYSNKLAYFTMETSGITEILPIKSLRIRPITVIKNTLNSFKAIYDLKRSPLLDLVLNPLTSQIQPQYSTENIRYQGYDTLDDTQQRIFNILYKRCIKLDVPNISLLDGAAGTGKTCMIVNLALQLVNGKELPKPLKILICSKTNGCIDEITSKILSIRDKAEGVNSKIQVVRFGFLQHMDSSVQRVSVQMLKDTEEHSKFTSYDELIEQKNVIGLKIQALTMNESFNDLETYVGLTNQLYKIDALLQRFEGLDKTRLRDKTTFILNSCDIVCTTLGSISQLQKYVSNFDVCIIDEATQCNEPITLLPFQFKMPSLVLVGDSQLIPGVSYSTVVKEKNYGNSLFARFQKLFVGKLGSPVFEMNFQYRLHQEILNWPNHQFYKNRLVPHETIKDTDFPITPYKIISYSLKKGTMESENIMLVIKVLLGHIDWKTNSIGIICTNFKQNFIMKNKLREHPFITSNTCESYLAEKDVIIIWISEEFGMYHLVHEQLLNMAVTRAKKSLLICGANLTKYKNRPLWKSLLENAQSRKRIQQFTTLTKAKVCTSLSKEICTKRKKCNICQF